MFSFRRSPLSTPASAPSINKAWSPDEIESDKKPTIAPARGTFSEPIPVKLNRTNPFDDDDDWGRPTSSSKTKNGGKGNVKINRSNPFDDDDDRGRPTSLYKARNGVKGNSRDQDFDSMPVQELEGYGVNRAEETTTMVNSCLRIAEDIRQDATRTLETLHHQGEQITGTHMMAVDIDRDLSRGEKLLSSLGGMFSMPWKPKLTREITGPVTSKEAHIIKPASKEQRENLGVAPAHKSRSRVPPLEPTNAMQKIELEKAKQDDALSDLSNLLGELKFMATDMGSELDRQNKSLEHVSEDVDELNTRVKGANRRAHHLLQK
ncbi:hypothetical protein Leryth_001574 [Lithospermum erythrorhizon]|uniref:SNARE protein n=1 Tax=Lithospermum erythrorhizon TaxID=34254 RepID=A0AAV3PZ21_LITER|nr:hypothetical protein Leryth_001574 [Lithospermum erythrorhizon]